MKVDVVLSLDDFKKVGGQYIDEKNTRICVEQKPISDYTLACKVWVSTALPDRILKCEVSINYFNRLWLQSPSYDEERKRYNEWVKEAYQQVKEKLGFKPIEGYWSSQKEE